MLVEGLSSAEIAARLTLSPGTVKWYLKQIYTKLDVNKREQAVQRAKDLRLLERGLASSLVQAVVVEGEETVRPGQAAPVVALQNPYKGLCAFQEADAPDFFGRETLTGQLVERLAETGPFNRFLAVVGPSGSGKSSVVRAGLIPALRRDALPGSAQWFIVEMLPGAHPLEEVEIALTRIAAKTSPNIMEQLRRDERGLLRVARMVLPDDESQLVLVIDQFEELFTLVEDPGETAYFMESLYVALTDPHSPLRVIITLRADFYDRPLTYPHFSDLVSQRTQAITPLKPDELEQAIVAPARRVGVMPEAGLVAAIVARSMNSPARCRCCNMP